MIIAVAGDTHANMSWVCSDVIPYAVKAGAQKIVQVGDFGFIWPGTEQDKNLRKLNRSLDYVGLDLHFLPGNHEDHDGLLEFARTSQLSPEGHYEIGPRIFYTGRISSWTWAGVRMAAVGGAVSIDRQWRQDEGRRSGTKLWWERERLDGNELRDAREIGPVDVLFTHDAPTTFPETWLKADLDSTAYRQAMTDVGRALTPRYWLHGHYHHYVRYAFPHDRHECDVISLDCDHSPRTKGVAILDLAAIRNLPCAHWCRICPDIEGADPCDDCPDCTLSLAAAEDATWD